MSRLASDLDLDCLQFKIIDERRVRTNSMRAIFVCKGGGAKLQDDGPDIITMTN